MTALSDNFEAKRQDGEMIDVKVLAGATIYKGALVVDKNYSAVAPISCSAYNNRSLISTASECTLSVPERFLKDEINRQKVQHRPLVLQWFTGDGGVDFKLQQGFVPEIVYEAGQLQDCTFEPAHIETALGRLSVEYIRLTLTEQLKPTTKDGGSLNLN